MNKLIISNNQLKNIINDDWQKNIIALAPHKISCKATRGKASITW